MRILKGLLMLVGGLLMTIACFLPWRSTQLLCLHLQPQHTPCPSPPLYVSASLWDISGGTLNGTFQFGGPSSATAGAVLLTSVLLMVVGVMVLFGASDIPNGTGFLHPLTVIGVIGSETYPNSIFIVGSGLGWMSVGFVLAGLGVYVIRPREKTPKAEGREAHAPVSSNTPTTKTE